MFFRPFLRECTGCPVASYMTAIIINRDLQPTNRPERVDIVVPGRWTMIIESINELTLQYVDIYIYVVFAAAPMFHMSSFVITCHIYGVNMLWCISLSLVSCDESRQSGTVQLRGMWSVIRLDFTFEDLVDRWLVGLWSNFWHIIVGVGCWILLRMWR